MAESQTGDVDLIHGAIDAAANARPSDRAVNFRFVVTLKCLSMPLDTGQTPAESFQPTIPTERPRPTPVAVAAFAMPAPPAISVVVSAPSPAPPVVSEASPSAPRPDVFAPGHGTTDFMPSSAIASPPPGLPWELAAPEFRLEAVVPTVLRAFKRSATEVEPESAPAALPQPSPSATVPAVPPIPESGTATIDPAPAQPSVPNLYTAPSRLRNPLFWKLGAGALAGILIVVLVWHYRTLPAVQTDQPTQTQTQRSVKNDTQTSMQSADWGREPAVGGDPGVKQARQLVLYKPALAATNSRIEFSWTTDSGDLGIVFRAKDLGNYYAVRMKVLNPRTAPTLDVEYFSVYQFVESRPVEKFLVFSKLDPVVRVRLDTVGPAFTLYLQDNATVYWTDARLTSGALGFFEEWNRAPQVNLIRVSFGQRSEFFRKPLEQALEFLARNEPSALARKQSKALGG